MLKMIFLLISVAVQGSLVPDPKLYVWDIENDNIIYFNFASGKNDQEKYIYQKSKYFALC